jgi:hypothetical protein
VLFSCELVLVTYPEVAIGGCYILWANEYPGSASGNGAKTLSITTFNIKTLCITTFSIMTLRIPTFSITVIKAGHSA